VEYVYSISSPGASIAIVRFKVGTNEEDAELRTYNKMYSNFDKIPPGVSQPLIKPRSIDNVPILALTLHGGGYDGFQLRRVAAELENEIKQIPQVSETTLIGGQRRALKVAPDATRMAGFQVGAGQLMQALQAANQDLPSGSFSKGNREFLVQTGRFLSTPEEVGGVVVGAYNGRPVYVRDVASVTDGQEDPSQYVMFGLGAAGGSDKGGRAFSASGPAGEEAAVTLAIAKRKGTNAIVLANQILKKVEGLRGVTVPSDVQITVTRNYGETAADKSNELLKHLLLATLSVTLLVALTLGFRESGVVLIAVPVTLALTLLVFLLYGYTLNRVTLFALIFSIGILVDDAIVVVENVVRHFRLPENHGRPPADVVVEAVDEVGNPTILATFAVIAAIIPMAFVRGLMGPYMKPIPVGASAAMLFSLFIAFAISPWAALRLLRAEANAPHSEGQERRSWTTRLYYRVMEPLLHRPRRRWVFLAGVVTLLILAVSMFPLKLVRVKMLPFDNKSEFQVIVDMPEGTTLEQTQMVLTEMAGYLRTVPEVVNYQTYAGTASPYNFNGLVRHYFSRRGPNVGDLQVNLLPRHERKAQSHEIAKRVRPQLQQIALKYGARVKVAEVPPGPPVLQTLVAEVYGPSGRGRAETAARVMDVFEKTPGVVDTDWYVEAPQPKYSVVVDREKAALNGVDVAQATQVVNMALAGASTQLAHLPTDREDVPITLRMNRADRSDMQNLMSLRVQGRDGNLVPLSSLVSEESTTEPSYIYHKNLQPVVYVTADVAGREESPVYAILKLNQALDKIRAADGTRLERFTTHQPFLTTNYSMKWDGEWHITYEVFRDLGLAFAAVMVLIYVLVVGWFKNFKTPIVIMAAIPFSLVGILPGHMIMGAFFTATSMIGFIAGAGIVVRNSIILVDFIELRRRQGMELSEAVIDAGADRFRPMLLTAAAVIVGSSVILFDPIFQGLAISLMAGEVASLLLSRMTVPVLYYMAKRREAAAVVSGR
jgi:multidrug efflux pump subunit AcrB